MKRFFLNVRTCTCMITAAALLLLSACSKDNTPQEDVYNTRGIAAAANNNFNLTLFALAMQSTGYVAELSKPGPFMVLAPSNAAFIADGIHSESDIIGAASRLAAIVPYHIYPAALQLDTLSFAFNREIKMKDGLSLFVSRQKNTRDTAITVNGIRIEQSGLQTTNGVIYLLDRMLKPTSVNKVQEVVANEARLTFFNAALLRSGMQGSLSSPNLFTLFAPSNQAFIAMGITSTDSIYKMDPGFLQEIVGSHIAKGRNFIYDYIMKAEPATDTYLEEMLNGTKATMQLLPLAGRPDRFRGIVVHHTNTAGIETEANIVNDNLAAANGVVHIIDQLFIP